MRVTVPGWYRDFHCIADACTDSCCVGWEIDIDDESLARYRDMPGAFGDYLRAHIDMEAEPAHFILDGEHCPFLDERGLCWMILTGGEEMLCDICARHPRFYEWFGDECEIGLGLCCEEACRLWLTVPEPFAFTSYETDEEPDEREYDPALLKALRQVRARMLALLEDQSRTLDERLGLIRYLAGEVQDTLDMLPPEAQASDIPDALEAFEVVCADEEACRDAAGEMEQDLFTEILETMASFEPIHPQWPETLRNLAASVDALRESAAVSAFRAAQSGAYARVAGYFLCRYLLKAVHTGDVYGPVMLARVSAELIALLEAKAFAETGVWTQTDRINLLKMYSQELEYDPDNIDALTELLY